MPRSCLSFSGPPRPGREPLTVGFGGFPKLGVPFLGVPIIRTIVFWGLYWGPYWETTIWGVRSGQRALGCTRDVWGVVNQARVRTLLDHSPAAVVLREVCLLQYLTLQTCVIFLVPLSILRYISRT